MYFGDDVEKALLDYIEGPWVMVAVQVVSGDENALFFSLQKKRVSVYAVENLVEKYAKEFVPQKKITPHTAIEDQNRRRAASVIKLWEK